VLELYPAIFPNWDRELADSLLEDFRLPVKRRIKKLSRGMLSSAGILAGLASRAPLTIFDERYLGLDDRLMMRPEEGTLRIFASVESPNTSLKIQCVAGIT